MEIYFRFRFWSLGRYLHIILHQATELRTNRSTQSGNMTSYPFLKMAAATAIYYFRFRICWRHCLQSISKPNFVENRDISIGGWDITTSGFEIQTSAILEFYFRFRSRQFAVICMLVCIRLPNFVQIEAPTAEIWRHIHFSRWRSRPLNTTSGYVFVDVFAFSRNSKPNFVEISQLAAEI